MDFSQKDRGQTGPFSADLYNVSNPPTPSIIEFESESNDYSERSVSNVAENKLYTREGMLNNNIGSQTSSSNSSINNNGSKYPTNNFNSQENFSSNCSTNLVTNDLDNLKSQKYDTLHNENISDEEVVKPTDMYAQDTLPQWYTVKGNIVTKPLITANLPKMFQSLPIHGAPECKDDLEAFQMTKIRQFVGCDLEDDEFDELHNYCSPEHLKTGSEIIMQTAMPVTNKLMTEADLRQEEAAGGNTLATMKRQMSSIRHYEFHKKLKYRGVRLMALSSQYADVDNTPINSDPSEPPLEPGKDILYRVRIYRPFAYSNPKDRVVKVRHSVFSCDVVLLGRQSLAALRDRLVCQNDVDMRVDVSASPIDVPLTTAKEIFPSGFLFINNVFYVDRREGCLDHSAPLRRWAARRGLGTFPARDMASTALHQLVLKLGYPEVYVHQGSCEHLFTFSEVRLLSPQDPLSLDCYPLHLSASQDQAVYCTTCAEFSAKWVVVGCSRVPFDPAFFCDTCFNLYLYKDGEKIGDFKAFTYKGNEMNMLKPQASYLGDGGGQAEGGGSSRSVDLMDSDITEDS